MMDLSNVPVTLLGVGALLPIAGIVWGASKIASAIDRITDEFREFKVTVEKKLELHDVTINTHTVKIATLETRAETTHERLERYEKKS